MARPHEFSNNPFVNAVMQNVSTDSSRGLPAAGKVVYDTRVSALSVCTSTGPNPTLLGGGTWRFGGAGAISYVGAGAVTASTGTSFAPALHASTAEGDLLIATYAARKAASAVKPAMPVGSGWWTLHERASTTLRVGAWATIANSGEAAPTVTLSSADDPVIMQVHTYRGASGNYLVDYNGVAGVISELGAAVSTLTITPVASNYWGNPDGWMLLEVIGARSSAGLSITTANGFTSRADNTSAAGSGISLSVSDVLSADWNQNTTWPTYTLASGTAELTAIGVCIRPLGG